MLFKALNPSFKVRLRRTHPYTVPAIPISPQRTAPNREMAVGTLWRDSSHASTHVPGAFPSEPPLSPGLTSDLEYDYDDETDLDLYESDESLDDQHGRRTSERRPSSSETEEVGDDVESDSSLDDMYSAEDFPLEDEVSYLDSPTPTPPSSSPSGAHQLTSEATPPNVDTNPELAALALPSPPGIQLSEEQQHVLRRVLAGESVFFTGSAGATSQIEDSLCMLTNLTMIAGTGKSVLLRAIIQALGGSSETVAVTASTGVAAANIGGRTLHAFAG